MARKIYKLSDLTAYAYQVAIKEAAEELNEAFHFDIDPKDTVLVEETADDFGLWFTANGHLTCPKI